MYELHCMVEMLLCVLLQEEEVRECNETINELKGQVCMCVCMCAYMHVCGMSMCV